MFVILLLSVSSSVLYSKTSVLPFSFFTAVLFVIITHPRLFHISHPHFVAALKFEELDCFIYKVNMH